MQDLYNELNKKKKDLTTSVKQLRISGGEYASAYSSYRVELAKELLRLKDEGMPVTMAYDVARGKPEIAKLKYEEILKEAIYKANQESINALKLEIKIIDEQISREWSSQ